MGNMLGWHWDSHAITTQDIDIVDSNRLPVGITNREIDLQKALLESDLGVFPIPALDRKSPSTGFMVRNRSLQVDFLTPLHGKKSYKPVLLKNLNTYAQPLRFMDYLLEDTQAAVAVTKAGILVNVPAPARYAFHKMMTTRRRPAYWHTKARKDLAQAQQLFRALLEIRPDDISVAWAALQEQPDAFRKAVQDSWKRLDEDLRLRLHNEANIPTPH